MTFLEQLLKSASESPIKSILVIFLICVLTIYSHSKIQRWLRLPAGPLGLPLLGYFPFMDRFAPYKTLLELSKTYGPVFTVQMGTADNVILVGWEAIKEAFGQDHSNGRPKANAFTALNPLEGFGTASGHEWREQKRVSARLMRDLGAGRNTMEVHITDEISRLISAIQAEGAEQVQIRRLLSPSVSNNVAALAFGKRYDYGHRRRVMLDNMLDPSTTNMALVVLMIIFPNIPGLFRFLGFFSLLGTDKTRAQNVEVIDFVRRKIEKHEKTLDKDNVRDYIDGFLLEIYERQKTDPDTFFNKRALLGNVIGFFFAGSDTVRTTLEWLFLTIATYPEVQKKLFAELESVIGRSRTPSWADRVRMPYTQAVLQEIQRWKTVVPLNLPRWTTDTITVQGIKIPKHTRVIANIYSVHHDAKIWGDPENFRPERFLDPEGNVLKREEFIAFSYGKRSCPGEAVATNELFLYVTSLVQKFEMTLPEGVEADFVERNGVTAQPRTPVKLLFKGRK